MSKQQAKIDQLWKTIESAPKDGTIVDLWHKEGFRQTDVWWDESDKIWSCVMSDSDFTHWMPSPCGPEIND